ncbi:MAG: hypothetical protein RL662_1892 [Bacteroidota bacterium]|jgi:tetratricopeptide (TPR) repeat protein
MEEKDILDLVSRYEQMLISGKNIYFDADDCDALVDYYDKLDDIETAKNILDLGLKIHPDSESLMLRYAKHLVYDGAYTPALDYLNSHFNTYEFDQYLLRIECLLQLGLYAEAHELSIEVLADEDTDTEVILSELGFLYVEAEYFDEAILHFEKSLEYDPENIEVLNDLAYAYEAKGDFDSSIHVCERILDVDPYSFDGWLTLGKLHSLQEEYEKAIDAFDFALALDDSNTSLLKLKAHCLLLSNRVEEAIVILEQCLGISDDDDLLHLTLAECYMNVENYDQILNVILAYENKFGESAESLARKSYAFFSKGDLDTSFKLLDKALSIDTDSFEANIIAGDIYLKSEKNAEAEAFYLKALSTREENNEEVLEKLIRFYITNNNYTSAITYQQQLTNTNESSSTQSKLALLYLEAGEKDNFTSYIHTLDIEALLVLFFAFYPDEEINLSTIDRDYIIKRLMDVYEYRLLYKNIQF